MKPLRTAILARVSTDEQAKFGFSIENQLDKLRAYAKENNLLIVDEYVDEGFSAGTMKRPALQQLLNDLDRIDLIIFTRLDRFSRNVLDANEMVKLFLRKKVSIKAIEEDDIDTSTADGMFMFNLKVSLAQRELAKGSERITTVFDYKIKQGQPITGKLPWGYKIEEDANGIKKVVKDKEAEPIINDVFKHFMTYQSIRQTSVYINEKYGLNKVYSTYSKLFKNPMYSGAYRGNLNYCDPYITHETYLMIRELLKRNIKVRRKHIPYLFTGLILCPKCKTKMYGIYYKNKSGKEYIYYRCSKRKTNFCDDILLHHTNEKVIENYLLENIEKEIQKYIYDVSVKLDKAPKPKINIKDITDEMDRLTIAFRKGRIKEDVYDHDYEILEKQLADAQKEMPKETDISGLEDFLNSGWKNVYDTLPREDKRALFRSIIKNISKDDTGEWVVNFLL